MLESDPAPYEQEALIDTNVRYLKALHETATQAGSYAALLSGDSDISKPPVEQHAISEVAILEDLEIYEPYQIAPNMLLNTTQGITDLVKTQGLESPDIYTFYLSLNLSKQPQVDLGEKFYRDVVTKAIDQTIPLISNQGKHAHDTLVFSTITSEHTIAFAQLLHFIYPEYENEDLFYDAPHFFQGRVGYIPEGHIGYAQGPELFDGNRSHSLRMRELGERIDQITFGRLSTPTFSRAAKRVGVQPDRPYLLAR